MTSLSVSLFSAPPPTVNSLGTEERSRLLRSTRKITAVLGATPIVVEMTAGVRASPKATRREARIFHSPSSSVSSLDSSEPDYVLVKSTSRSSPYQVQLLPPTPRPSVENKPTSRKRKGTLPPVGLAFDMPGSTRSGSAHPKGAEQPRLLRARAVPEGSDICIKSNSNHGRVSNSLSPFSFNMDTTSPTMPNMPTPPHMLNDREKRRKMAKLTRTLGENIPPELVFQEPLRRSISVSHPRVDSVPSFSKSSKYAPIGAPPPLAVAETPIPTPRTSTSSEHSTKSTKRRHRPRSLTLGSSSAIAAATAALTRGTTSLDAPPVLPKKELAFTSTAVQPVASEMLQVPSDTTAFGRRKEREWSGEWNLRDMDDVARRLRGLKGR